MAEQEMDTRETESQIRPLENILRQESYDFSAKYMALTDLNSLLQTYPNTVRTETLSLIEHIFRDNEISRQTQSYFLYKEAAQTLITILKHPLAYKKLSADVFSTMMTLLKKSSDHAHRAVAEALGSMECSIRGPNPAIRDQDKIPEVCWKRIVNPAGWIKCSNPVLFGRSLVFPSSNGSELLVIKLARSGDSLESLFREISWMNYLRDQLPPLTFRFDIPVALEFNGDYVFSIKDTPPLIKTIANTHPKSYAICFKANRDYFIYPSGSVKQELLTKTQFREIMLRNSWLLGKLLSFGIIHTAPIPLFHNRVQINRRRDNGVYEWPRAGRLDGWLRSCSYPNIGLSGIRDFEHFLSYDGRGKNLYNHIGSHLLSLLLVSGSYFRNKDIARMGFDKTGKPADTRDLFDEAFLIEIIKEIFSNYYDGFVGVRFWGELPFELDKLTSRLIEEMGIDRHMEEILRIADQNEMAEDEFREFLTERGFPDDRLSTITKGAEDIVINTGPHLGGFNERISLPELIESVGSMSAMCISGRFLRERSI